MNREELQKTATTMGGLLILGVMDGTPTAQAGIKYGDILLTVNGQPTPDFQAYVDAKALNTEGMSFQVFRGGEVEDFTVIYDKDRQFNPAAALAELAGKRLIPTDIDTTPATKKMLS